MLDRNFNNLYIALDSLERQPPTLFPDRVGHHFRRGSSDRYAGYRTRRASRDPGADETRMGE